MRFGMWAPWRAAALAAFILVNYAELTSSLQWTWSLKLAAHAALWVAAYAVRSAWKSEFREREEFARSMEKWTGAEPQVALPAAL